MLSSSVVTLFCILLLLSQSLTSLSLSEPKSTKSQPFTRSKHSSSLHKKQAIALPLRKQATHFAANPPNKLILHHNISLTVQISVGTPLQNLSLVLDTGSELSWLLCNSTSAPHFLPLSSTSFSPIPCSSPFCTTLARDLPMPPQCDPSTQRCHVSLSYADASTSEGYLSLDNFFLTQPFSTAFGCIESTFSSSGEDRSTAGILGMNRGSLSFVTQSKTRKFSYCISDRDSSGVLLIGDSDPIVPLNYTPLIEISLPLPYFDRVAYSIQLEGIKLGNIVLPIPKSVLVPDHTGAGQTMVDSGTQFTFLLGPAYDMLKSEFLRWTSRTLRVLNEPEFAFQGAFDTCFLIRQGTALPDTLPEVSLMFRGAEVRVSGERLLYRVSGERRGWDDVWCLTFGNSDLVPMEAYVIGHHHQQNLWVEYDLENSRVGFAPVQCDWVTRQLL